MGIDPILFFGQQMIRNNMDKIPNTPWAQAAVNAIMNGDKKSGAQIANNWCNSNEISVQEGLQKAGKFFTS